MCLYCSDQPVLWGEECVHVGGFSGGDAAADGAESSTDAAHANRHPVPHHVSTTGRLRHEHPVPPHRQAGGKPNSTTETPEIKIFSSCLL